MTDLLPPLDGPEAIADQLVELAHRCADWDVWGGARAIRYWDAFTERVRASSYAGPSLADWWEAMVRRMSVHQPARADDRRRLAELLAAPDQAAVRDCLRNRAEHLVLRQRVRSDHARLTRQAEEALTT